MPPEESSYPADWLRLAERDWKRVQMLLGEGDVELAGFCLQQAVEKFLKAFLISRGWQLRRIHNLEALLDEAVAYEPALEIHRELCQKITAFYIVERYPLIVESGMTEEDVRTAFERAGALTEKLKEQGPLPEDKSNAEN